MHIVPIEKILLVFFVFSVLLIIFPEFFYFKDIYPQHFRSNTMFKLGYQAFMLFSFVSGYAIVAAIQALRKHVLSKKARVLTMIFLLLVIPQVLLVSIYPLFSVRSYFDSLRMYKGLDGLMWLNESYPEDYAGIQYLNSEFANTGDPKHLPVIVEADGDSYTDYARFSAFTGFPAVIGWPVHEWLWRGSYDVVAPRREEVRVIYESEDRNETRFLLDKYNVTYIIVGGMERKKFSAIQFDKLNELASVVFQKGDTTIYRIYK